MDNFSIEKYDHFFEAILKLKDVADCRKFFEDVCTIKELEAIAQRLDVAELLAEGKNYLEIRSQTGASSATISRVAKCLNYGAGGYPIVMDGKESNDE